MTKVECGQLFDNKYKILRILGQGGMGRVYLAENIKLGTLWAVKEISKKTDSKINFLAEPNILKKLNHPTLPKIFDIMEDDENIYIIVDYIEGTSLDKKLTEAGKFSEGLVIDWAKQLCDALIYLHALMPNPIIYRDMKPSNIVLTCNGNIKLIDFGIAREFKKECESDTIYIGTRGYAAPEQYGAGQTSVRTDIYSLGVTLYHLITGRSPNEPPFEIKPVRFFDKSLSREIEEIIYKCTRPDPAQRYQSVQELLDDIHRLRRQGRNDDESSKAYSAKQEKVKNMQCFRKIILTVWDNAEFGCEMAYIAAKLTNLKIMLIDLDLLSPKADLYLNIKKYPENIVNEGFHSNSGINIVMDLIEKYNVPYSMDTLGFQNPYRRTLGFCKNPAFRTIDFI